MALIPCTYAHDKDVEGVRCAHMWRDEGSTQRCPVRVCPDHGFKVNGLWYCVTHQPRVETVGTL